MLLLFIIKKWFCAVFYKYGGKMKIIDNNFKITSILVRGFYTSYLTASLIEQFKDKNVLLLQDWKCYHSCKRFELVFGLDLNLLIEDLIFEFQKVLDSLCQFALTSGEIYLQTTLRP